MGENLRKILMVPAIAFSLSGELNGPTSLDVIGNSFSQPNVTSQLGRGPLEWYGSGDVNLDGKVDKLDLDAMNSGVKNDMADIDGDENPSTQNDKNILSNYLNKTISYLPSNWNELSSRIEREDWIKKMIRIDTTSNISVNDLEWICADRTKQVQFNFYGISNAEEFIKTHKTAGGKDFSLKNLARYNIPVYILGTKSNTGEAHSVLGVLVGDDPLNFNDWYFWSAYGDNQILPGDAEMDKNNPVSLGLESYIYDPLNKNSNFIYLDGIVKWDLTNGVASKGTSQKPYLTLNNPNIIKVHIAKGSLEDIVIDKKDIPEGQNLTPDFLKSKGFNSIPDTSKENTNLAIKLGYIDSDTTWNVDSSKYSFNRKFYDSIYSGGITKSDTLDTLEKITIDNATPVEISKNNIPKNFKVYQNYPNPFNPSTTIKYQLEKAGNVKLEVYNILGQKVYEESKENVSSGINYFKEINISSFSSGNYIYRITSGGNTEIKKMTLLK